MAAAVWRRRQLSSSSVPAPAPPAAQLQELDEVLITPKSQLPLRDFLQLPRYQNVVLSPNGKRILVVVDGQLGDDRLLLGFGNFRR